VVYSLFYLAGENHTTYGLMQQGGWQSIMLPIEGIYKNTNLRLTCSFYCERI